MSAGAPLQQPIPLARSILWSPVSAEAPEEGEPTGDIPFPIFLAQSALVAIHEHLAAPPRPGQGLLGFLVGDLCQCPETDVTYLVIDAALRLSQPIYGDRTTDIVTRIWERIEAQVEEAKGQLIGWYHSHPPLPLSLSAHDIETHEHYFTEPWQLALVLGSGPDAEPVSGFFRAGADEAWATTLLPFYELLSEEAARPGGKRRSLMTWKNYRASNPLADRGPRPQPKTAPPPPQPPREQAAPPPAAPSPPPGPPQTAAPKSDELVFLTSADDFASKPPTRTSGPRPRPPSPPRPLPPPAPPPRRHEPSPEAWAESLEQAATEPDLAAEPFDQPAELPVEEPPPVRVRPARRYRKRRRGRWVAAVGLLLLGGAGGVYVWANGDLPTLPHVTSLPKLPSLPKLKLPSLPKLPFSRRVPPAAAPKRRPPPQPPAAAPARGEPAPALPAPAAQLDRLADSVAKAVRDFGDRAGLFDRRQLGCDGLARGLLGVESRWVTYGTARRASGAPDRTHAARDQALYAGVDSVERRFEKSGCPRP